jgi:hypothetical protein
VEVKAKVTLHMCELQHRNTNSMKNKPESLLQNLFDNSITKSKDTEFAKMSKYSKNLLLKMIMNLKEDSNNRQMKLRN